MKKDGTGYVDVEGGGGVDGGYGGPKGAKAYLDDLACSSAPALLPSACGLFFGSRFGFGFFCPPSSSTTAILACLINNKCWRKRYVPCK